VSDQGENTALERPKEVLGDRKMLRWNGEITNLLDADIDDQRFNERLHGFYVAVSASAASGLELMNYLLEANWAETAGELPQSLLDAILPVLEPLLAGSNRIPEARL